MYLLILPFLQLHLEMASLFICLEMASAVTGKIGPGGRHEGFQKSMHRPAFSQSP